jgi:hypothetical protein
MGRHHDPGIKIWHHGIQNGDDKCGQKTVIFVVVQLARTKLRTRLKAGVVSSNANQEKAHRTGSPEYKSNQPKHTDQK